MVDRTVSTDSAIAVLSFTELLAPMESRWSQAQQTITQEKQKDPVPSFTNERICEVNKYLISAVQYMQSYLSSFHEDSLASMDDDELKNRQYIVCEASRQLVLMIGDRSLEFKKAAVHDTIAAFDQGKQNSEMVQNMRSLQLFLSVFEPFITSILPFEHKNICEVAVNLLDGLLNQSKIHADSPKKIVNPLERAASALNFAATDKENACALEQLGVMSEKLAEICKVALSEVQAVRAELITKMEHLQRFADALNRISSILITFLLFSLGKETDATVDSGFVASGMPKKCIRFNAVYTLSLKRFNGKPWYDSGNGVGVGFDGNRSWVFQDEADAGTKAGFVSKSVEGGLFSAKPWDAGVKPWEIGVVVDGQSKWTPEPAIQVSARSSTFPHVLKQWVTSQNAEAAHQMLEHARDAIMEEKATRKASSRMGYISSLSSTRSSLPNSDEFEIIRSNLGGAEGFDSSISVHTPS